MSDNVNGILLREETLEAMCVLSDEQRGRLVLALFADSGMCEQPELDPVTRMAFLCIAPAVRRAQEDARRKYTASVDNGKKGGRPKNQPVQDSDEETCGLSEKPMGFEKTGGFEKKPQVFKERNEEEKRKEEKWTKEEKQREEEKKEKYIRACACARKGNGPDGPAPGADAPAPRGGSASVKEPYTQEFEAFWKAYPRRTGKDAAFAAWKAKKRERRLPALPVLLQAIEAAKRTEQWQKEGGAFIPHPRTWISQGRWQDENTVETVQASVWEPFPEPEAPVMTAEDIAENNRVLAEIEREFRERKARQQGVAV